METTLVKSLSDIEKDKEIASLTEQVLAIGSKAHDLAVYDDASLKAASDVRLEAKRILNQLEVRRKFFVDPHNQFVKTINAWFKDPAEALTGAIDRLGARMVKYSDEVEAAAKAAEAKILADKRTLPETKSEKIAAIPEAPKTVRTDSGSTGFRIDKRLKITDAAQLPREYLVPDEKFILAALKAGKAVPGAELEDVKVPVGRSNW